MGTAGATSGAVADGAGGWIWEDGRALGAPFRLQVPDPEHYAMDDVAGE